MMIKRALSESGCPPHILDNLMENCHERRWPRGLSSLETRQNNRRIYDNYICRRVPGKNYTFCLTIIYFQPSIHTLFHFSHWFKRKESKCKNEFQTKFVENREHNMYSSEVKNVIPLPLFV